MLRIGITEVFQFLFLNDFIMITIEKTNIESNKRLFKTKNPQ